MEPYTGLADALARITAASTLTALWSTTKEFISQLGYTHLVAVDGAKIVGGAADAVMYTDAPRELFQAIDRELVYAEHPIVLRALRSPVPFTISELRADPQQKDKRWLEFLGDVVKRGDALIVPVYEDGDAKAGFSFGGEKPDLSPRARAILQVVAHATIAKVKDLSTRVARPSDVALSVREAQCLRLVAMGKPDIDIGKVLGISARTVRFHVDSAKGKLGVANRIQAVAKALRERIIAI